MSVAGILSSSLASYSTQSAQSQKQKFQQEFQQLGQDLQSGNLTAAQSDFATLTQYTSQSTASSSSQSTNPIAQEMTQLGKDIQSGNTSAAQQDYTTIQQDMQSHASHVHHHHHGSGSSSSSDQNEFRQLMTQLGQSLQAGNLTAAQQAYTTLQQAFQQSSQTGSGSTTSTANNVSVSV